MSIARQPKKTLAPKTDMAQETTVLPPQMEKQFREWAMTHGIEDVDSPESFYDYRGFWLESGGKPMRFGEDHFPDTYKRHGHPTFSMESQYSKGLGDGGMWAGDRFVRPEELQLLWSLLGVPYHK